MNFKNIDNMLPSELAAYAKTLEAEITRQAGQIKDSRTADTFIIEGETKFQSKKDMIASLDVGDVKRGQSFIAIEEKFFVKISDDRIDAYDSAIEAEGIAMLHRKD